MLDSRRLRVLCEVARQGSFSGAAESLGYTQPAISRQIATLEAEVGATLIRRVPKGAALTDAGRLLVDRAEAILAGLDDVENELRALAGLEGGRVRMATFASAASSVVPVAIAAFRERHPAVELSVVMADPPDSIPRLRAGELDLALSHDAFFGDPGQERGSGSAAVGRPSTGGRNPSTDGRGPSTDGRGPSAAAPAGLELVHLFDDPMYVAMRAGHPLAESPSLRLADFATEPWMLATTHTCPDSRLFLRACHAAGFEPTIAFQNDDYPAILGFVAAGVGVAMIPDMVARSVRDDVVVRDLDPPAPRRPILATVPYGYRSPAVSAMLAVLKEVSGEWVASRPPLSFPAKIRSIR